MFYSSKQLTNLFFSRLWGVTRRIQRVRLPRPRVRSASLASLLALSIATLPFFKALPPSLHHQKLIHIKSFDSKLPHSPFIFFSFFFYPFPKIQPCLPFAIHSSGEHQQSPAAAAPAAAAPQAWESGTRMRGQLLPTGSTRNLLPPGLTIQEPREHRLH